METFNEFAAPEIKKRPDFLSVLCILSFIWEGFIALACVVMACMSGLLFNFIRNFSETERYAQLSEMQQQAFDQIVGLGQGIFTLLIVVSLVFTLVSVLGVALMWKLKRSGFYIYTIINGILVVLNLVQLNIFMVLVGIAFIVMYGLNLKHMKK